MRRTRTRRSPRPRRHRVATNSKDRASASRKAWVRALELTAPIGRTPSRTFPALIEDLALRFGDAPAILSEHGCWSYRELAAEANRYARGALGHGIAAGDVVCLIMSNCPDYLAIWLGITRVGGVV